MKVLLFANTDWYLYNFRRGLASKLQEEGHDVLLLSPQGPYGEKLQKLGFRWEPFSLERRSLNPFRELGTLVQLRERIKLARIDVLHNFTIKCAVYGSLAARSIRRQGRPRVVNAVTGLGYVFSNSDLRARLLRPMVRVLMRVAFGVKESKVVLQNPDDVALLTRAKIVDPADIRLIPGSGVCCDRFVPAGAQGARSVLRILLPARLLWDKGVAEFVEAIRILRSRSVPGEFLLAGAIDSGNPAAVPISTVREWETEGLLEWLGQVDDMPALFRSVDIVTLPSYREGLPKGLIEAAACELALVTTDAPGCRDVVVHEQDGLIVPPKDAAALADALERLCSDWALRIRLGQAARKKALELFDERSIVKQTIAVYEELRSGTNERL